jgi:hypothetical protein
MMAEQPDYTAAAEITHLTLREAVLRRPGVYFGSFTPADWPLVILGWTVLDLLGVASDQSPRAQITVGSDGTLTHRYSRRRCCVRPAHVPLRTRCGYGNGGPRCAWT